MSERTIEVPKQVAEMLEGLRREAAVAASTLNAYFAGVTQTTGVGECQLIRVVTNPPSIVVQVSANGKPAGSTDSTD